MGDSENNAFMDKLADALGEFEESASERAQHVLFAHHIFRALVFRDPIRFFVLAEIGKCVEALKALWEKVGEDLVTSGLSKEIISDNGLAVEVLLIQGRPAFLVQFPPPQGPVEAYFAAVVMTQPPRRRWALWHSAPRIRFFTLEHGFNVPYEHTTLGEWTRGGSPPKLWGRASSTQRGVRQGYFRIA